MTREELLELENKALRIHAKNLALLLNIALMALRESNDLIAADHITRKSNHTPAASLQRLSETFEALGIQSPEE